MDMTVNHPPHGQNTLGEIPDTTEVIKIAGL